MWPTLPKTDWTASAATQHFVWLTAIGIEPTNVQENPDFTQLDNLLQGDRNPEAVQDHGWQG
jgi:hypothetical protein